MSQTNVLHTIQKSLQDNTLLYLTRYGSHLYGVTMPNSDEDYKGLFLPTTKDLLLQTSPKTFNVSSKSSAKDEKNTKDDIDAEVYALQYFFHLLRKSDTNMVSILFSRSSPDAIIYEHPQFKAVFDQADPYKLMSRNLAGMAGYVRSQVHKYGLKGFKYSILTDVITMFESFADTRKTLKECLQETGLDVIAELEQRHPNKKVKKLVSIATIPNPDGTPAFYLNVLEKKLNFREKVSRHLEVLNKFEASFGHRARAASEAGFADQKAVYHAFRVLAEIEELHTTGTLTYPIHNRKFLLEIRQGEHSMDALTPQLEERLEYVESLYENSLLPKKVDRKYMDELVLEFYESWH